MRYTVPLFAVACLFGAFWSPAAMAQSNANAGICAAGDDDAVSPEQRVAACTALIADAKDSPQALAAALVNRAAANFYINKMALALADLNRAIALDAKNARAFRERAESYRVSGNLDRALADTNEAVRLDPDNAEGFDTRGNVFNNNGQYDRAIADYTEAVRLDPTSAQAFMDRGVAHYFKRDYEGAIKDYDEAIKLNPKRARAYTNRGAAYKKLGRTDRAILDESEAIKLDPEVAEYFDNRGLSYAENGDYDRAIADYNEAIRLKPQANFLTNRGDSYQKKGDVDRAIADYDRALKLNPGFYLAYNNRSVAFRAKGDFDHAIADLEQVLRIDPRLDSAAEDLADLRQERDRRAMVSGDDTLPTFNCRKAKLAVEKAICSDPDLVRLDRQLDDAYKAALAKLDRAGVARLRREQHAFIASRNTSFGRPEYQLKRELEQRLLALRRMAVGNRS
ncbi:MAG TPA: tetratricopeptide repeat protein [Pseudolabrys sp.]|jgi:tetratricopeptide (TPR) repeat protein|nr:tetratricopeptide repeat protein [Pseudolabrys sp.]